MIDVKTYRPAKGSRAERGARIGDSVELPVLSARRGGPAKRLGGALQNVHPALVFVVLMLVGLVATAVLSICLGLLVTRVLEPNWGIGAADERVNVWLATHRTNSRTDASLIGSIVAGGVVLPILVGLSAIICAVLRRWRIAAFLVSALAVESASYRLTTLVVHSNRPNVARLENLPVNASYPSGHTAASIAVYGGVAVLIASGVRHGGARALALTFALAMVTLVAFSRMYRGMHHPLDVAGGIVLGVVTLTVLVFVCRTAGATADARKGVRGTG